MNSVQVKKPSSVERSVPGTDSWINLHADHLSRYLFAADYVAGRRVLDAGTGPGYGAAMLKAAGALRVQAVDIDAVSIEQAQTKYQMDGLEFLVDNCETFATVDGPLDVICSFENIEHLHHPEKFVEAAARLLTPDGVLLCSTPDRALTNTSWIDGKPGNPFHINEWYSTEFRELLAAQFMNIEMRAQVTSLSLDLRRQSVDSLNQHLTYLWGEPLLRLSRAVGRLTGRRQRWPSVTQLAAASPTDYPIITRALVGVIGQPWCHFAVCRNPRQ